MSLTNRDLTIVSQIIETIEYNIKLFNPIYLAQQNEYIYYSGDEIPDFIEIANQLVKDLSGSDLKIGNNNNMFVLTLNHFSIRCFLYEFDYGIRIVKYIEVRIQTY